MKELATSSSCCHNCGQLLTPGFSDSHIFPTLLVCTVSNSATVSHSPSDKHRHWAPLTTSRVVCSVAVITCSPSRNIWDRRNFKISFCLPGFQLTCKRKKVQRCLWGGWAAGRLCTPCCEPVLQLVALRCLSSSLLPKDRTESRFLPLLFCTVCNAYKSQVRLHIQKKKKSTITFF